MGWYGCDLDGTISEHYWPEKGDYDHTRVGDPVPLMVERVKAHLARGEEVRIFTARVGPVADPSYSQEDARRAIEAWCIEHLGQKLVVTATKDYSMIALYDDRAIQIIPDTGVRVDGKA